MSDSEIDALFSKTLIGHYDDDAPWKAVHTLRKLGTSQVFDRASEWCCSSNESERERGLDILAQIGTGSDAETILSLRKKALPIVLELLEKEKAAGPTASAVYSLGHLGLPEAIPVIVSYAKHFNPDVRHAVAFALGSFANERMSVETLLALMKDDDDSVRDWATFGLGAQGDADNRLVRDALAAALDDHDQDVSFEAAIGLGRRRDRRAAGALEIILSEDADNLAATGAANLLLGFDESREADAGELLSSLRHMQVWGKSS